MLISLSGWIAIAVFVGVFGAIIAEWLHLTVAAFLGALLLIFFHVLSLRDAVDYISQSHGTLALFFGVMVMIRAFEPTQIFQYLGTQIVRLSRGQGKFLLLGIVFITVPICSVVPNATTVMLLAPLIPPIATEMGLDFIPLLILMVLVANSAGLLTIVGDPATFIVGDGINLSFFDYLIHLSLGGVLAVGVIVAVLPFLFKEIWQAKLNDLSDLPHTPINHPRLLSFGILIILLVLIFFMIGEMLPIPVPPGAVALLGASLALLLAHQGKIDTVQNIFRDLDWSTLIFFMSIFVIIGGLEKTDVIAQLSVLLSAVLGNNLIAGTWIILILVGGISSIVPNIPLVVAMMPLLKGYLWNAGLITESMNHPLYEGSFPMEVLPLFYAMMFGATLGGNGTLVGASANIVAAGIAEIHGKTMSFHRFLRYGLPVMALQIIVAGLYIHIRFLSS